MTPTIRVATDADTEFLATTDLRVNEETGETYDTKWGPAELEAHRTKMAGFAADSDKKAWVAEVHDATGDVRPIGAVMCRFHNALTNDPETALGKMIDLVFAHIGADLRPEDGRFCEVFQLWVDPAFRRMGLGTALKRQLEAECHVRGVSLLYTHTRADNDHVVALNLRLGYRQIRRGPLWDEVVRVSLVKRLL